MKTKYLFFLFLYTSLLLFSCEDDDSSSVPYVEICVEEGSHSFKPTEVKVDEFDVIAYEWTLDRSNQYTLCCGDQHDWNKLTGVSAHLFSNHKNSFMCAYRWTGEFYEVAPYFHKNSNVFFPEINDEIPILEVYPDANGMAVLSTHINVQTDRKTISLYVETNTGFLFFETTFTKVFNEVRIINTWFGGNQEANQLMCMKKEIIVEE